MKYERKFIKDSSVAYTFELIAVLGLWLFACSVEKIPGFRNVMDFI